MGVRLTRRQADTCRAAIQTTKILKRLEDHVLGKVILAPEQVSSARVLLAKSVPDLQSIEMKAEVTESPTTPEAIIAQGKMYGLTPEQLFGKKRRK